MIIYVQFGLNQIFWEQIYFNYMYQYGSMSKLCPSRVTILNFWYTQRHIFCKRTIQGTFHVSNDSMVSEMKNFEIYCPMLKFSPPVTAIFIFQLTIKNYHWMVPLNFFVWIGNSRWPPLHNKFNERLYGIHILKLQHLT
jgi:hypothetical protein